MRCKSYFLFILVVSLIAIMVHSVSADSTNISVVNGDAFSVQTYYGQGLGLSSPNDAGYIVQAIWLKADINGSDSGLLQVNTGDGAQKFEIVKRSSTQDSVLFEIYPEGITDTGGRAALGLLNLTRFPWSDVSVWEGKLRLDEGTYEGEYDVKLGTRSSGVQESWGAKSLIEKTLMRALGR